jgi:hypothetical protein
VSRPDQLLEVEVADVASIVVTSHGVDGSLDAVAVRDPVLVLLSVPLVREVARADHRVGVEFVQLDDRAVHEVGDEVR